MAQGHAPAPGRQLPHDPTAGIRGKAAHRDFRAGARDLVPQNGKAPLGEQQLKKRAGALAYVVVAQHRKFAQRRPDAPQLGRDPGKGQGVDILQKVGKKVAPEQHKLRLLGVDGVYHLFQVGGRIHGPQVQVGKKHGLYRRALCQPGAGDDQALGLDFCRVVRQAQGRRTGGGAHQRGAFTLLHERPPSSWDVYFIIPETPAF